MNYGRIYSVNFENVAVTAAQDLFDIAPATNKIIVLHGCWISQNNRKADAQEEFLRIKIIRGLATVGSSGGVFTPVPKQAADAAAGCTARINDTTVAVVGAGTTEVLWAETFNDRAGWVWLPTPENRLICTAASTRIVITMPSTPTASMNMSGTLLLEEIG